MTYKLHPKFSPGTFQQSILNIMAVVTAVLVIAFLIWMLVHLSTIIVSSSVSGRELYIAKLYAFIGALFLILFIMVIGFAIRDDCTVWEYDDWRIESILVENRIALHSGL